MMTKSFILALFAVILAVASAQVRGGAAASTRRRVRTAAAADFDAKYMEISEEVGQSEIFKIKQRYLKKKKEDMPKDDASIEEAAVEMSLSMSLSMSIEGRKQDKDVKQEKEDKDDTMSMSMSMSISM